MKQAFLIFLVVMCTRSAVQAQENWDIYMAQLDNKPASILVDLNVINFAPDVRFPYLVITGPKTDKVNDQGLPLPDAIAEMENILTETGNFITGLTAKALVGTVTCNGERFNYYYVKDTMGIRNALHRMYERNFRHYSYGIKIRKEPDWRTYRSFLYPNPDNMAWMDNTRSVTHLMEQGDSLTRPRKIKYAVLFKTDTGRNNFNIWALNEGFDEDRSFSSKLNTTLPYGSILIRNMPATLDTITKVTAKLREQAGFHDGKLDSWDAELMKGK